MIPVIASAPVRPTTAATLLVAAGVLAALPFRRTSSDRSVEPDPGIATGPRSTATASFSTGRPAEWSDGAGFDSSLAWQPVPITLPERPAVQLPPMPDSYYDLAFELEQPDPIRRRFSAAVGHRSSAEPKNSSDGVLSGSPDRDQQRETGRADRDEPIEAAEELIKDRFVYTPIQLPQEPPQPTAEPREPTAKPREPRSVSAQSASMIRPGVTPLDDSTRQRHFIREPR